MTIKKSNIIEDVSTSKKRISKLNVAKFSPAWVVLNPKDAN